MEVLQAYQTDLLKDLSTGDTINEAAFLELWSMAAMVDMERHLWLNLTSIKEKVDAVDAVAH